ncbi:early nodulin-like protein 1 [Fagus crenata]
MILAKDSLLQVSKKDYDSCSAISPTAVYTEGNTKVKLDRPCCGPVAPTSGGTNLRGGFMVIFGVLIRLVLLEMMM